MTTISATVATGDWAHETDSTGGVVVSPGLLSAGVTPAPDFLYSLARFSVAVPQGATIASASLNGYVWMGDDPICDFFCHDVGASPAPSSAAGDISGRVLTSASARWSATGVGEGYKDTPDLSGPIQEVVDRPGYTGIITLIWFPYDLSDMGRDLGFYVSPGAYDLTLTIEYSAAASGNGPLIDRPLSGAMII